MVRCPVEAVAMMAPVMTTPKATMRRGVEAVAAMTTMGVESATTGVMPAAVRVQAKVTVTAEAAVMARMPVVASGEQAHAAEHEEAEDMASRRFHRRAPVLGRDRRAQR